MVFQHLFAGLLVSGLHLGLLILLVEVVGEFPFLHRVGGAGLALMQLTQRQSALGSLFSIHPLQVWPIFQMVVNVLVVLNLMQLLFISAVANFGT